MRVITCEHCRESFAYQLDLQATGVNHDVLFVGGETSAEQARKKATENLLSKSKNVVFPIPCPNCGGYQRDMVGILKEDATINASQIAGGIIMLLAFLPLAFSTSPVFVASTVALATVGVIILVRGLLQAARFDPNAGDPEPRKSLARRQTLWGKELEELRATGEIAESAN